MLDKLSAEEVQLVRSISRRRRYAVREILFHEDDPADCLHVILSGRVAVVVNSAGGQELMFLVMGAGELVGELAILLPGTRRSASVRALESTETLVIPAQGFDRLRLERPAVNALLVRLLTAHVLRLSNRLREMQCLSVETRVRRRLLDLAEVYGGVRAGTVIPLSQGDVASLSGAVRATANRALKRDAEAGLVAVARRRVTILDPARLRQLASSED
jgi:CRP/FNR family cyclic AMP-dependent transcriptional regulator